MWLAKDPKVIAMAGYLAEDRAFCDWLTAPVGVTLTRDSNALSHVTRHVIISVTVTALLQVWGVTRVDGKEDGNDLYVPYLTVDAIDEIGEVPGLGRAMAFVEWVKEVQDGGVILPNFFDANDSTDELKRRKNAERQRKHREKLNNKAVTNDVTVTRDSNALHNAEVTPRGEESIVKKKETPSSPSFAEYGVHPDGTQPDSGPLREFLDVWNATAGAKQTTRFGRQQWAKLADALADPSWRWRDALKRFPLAYFGAAGCPLSKFIEPGIVDQILDGKYATAISNDDRPNAHRPVPAHGGGTAAKVAELSRSAGVAETGQQPRVVGGVRAGG